MRTPVHARDLLESDGTLAGIITEADFVKLAQSSLPRS
jgi:hypothetical protein